MIEMNRRVLVTGAAASGAALLAASPAAAQTYPQRPVRIIVPYPPGGGTDVFSRLLAAQMEREFGQTLIIDNRAGGGSTIGTQAVANAQPDGYTIGMVDSAFVTNPGLFKDKLPYDTRKDFIPVSLLSRTQLVLCVHPSSPFKTAQELVAYAKANPGKLTLGVGRHRNRHPPRRRAVPAGDRDRVRDRPLSRRRARDRRLPVRQGGFHLRRRSDHPGRISWAAARADWA